MTKVSRDDIERICASGLFDAEWYLEQYPDVRALGMDPAEHYLWIGAKLGRDPGPEFSSSTHIQPSSEAVRRLEFDNEFYVTFYPEVQRSDMSPLDHYRQIGSKKFLHPIFDENWYKTEYSDLASYQGSLRDHFLTVGQNQGRHPAFHREWYLREYPDVAASGFDPLEHYRCYGRKEGRHAAFDRNFYLNEYPDIANSSLDPFEHYDKYGRKEERYPAFNRFWYVNAYKDIGESDLDPYEHYKLAGRSEGRPLSPARFRQINKWGWLNTNGETNTPTTVEGFAPSPDDAFSPRVSVIVPNYNHADFLRERLDSIYRQTYRNFEVILLDDASTDDSVNILREYASRYDERTVCSFNTENSGGAFYQWRRGLEIASGDLVWIAESDDYCSPDFLSELVRFFRNNGVMLAFCRTDFVLGTPPRRVWTSEEYWAEVEFEFANQPKILEAHKLVRSVWGVRNIVPNVSGVLFRHPGRLAILDDEDWLSRRVCGDWIFYLSIIRGGLVGYSPNVTNFYRQHLTNTSVGTHNEDLFYQEHEITARYVARLYNVEEDVLFRHREVLYRHWCMKRGIECRAKFEKLFDVHKVIRERLNRKPNIAIATYALVTGGGETFPILMANLLFKRGFGVTLLNFEKEKTNTGIKSTLARAIPIIEPDNSANCGALLNKLGIELVHSHHAWADVTLAIALKDFPYIRHVVTMHGMYEILNIEDVRYFEPDLMGVDAFVYIADKNLTQFSSPFLRRKQFTKISNTVALPPLSKLSRRDLQIEETDFVLTLASRAVPEKGWDEAIQAVILANQKSKRPIQLLLIGEGPEQERLSKIRLPPFIKLLGFQRQVRDYFAISDAGLIASRFKGESCPLVLIECLSVDRPVISSNVGEVKNMLMAGDSLAGVLHELTDWTIDIPSLGEIIRKLANNADEYLRVRSSAPLAFKKFDQEVMIDQYINLYSHVIENKGKPKGVHLSVVLVAYNMARELKRTITTLSPEYQHLEDTDYEVIVVDNGSQCEYDIKELQIICPSLRFIRFDGPNQSPVDAVNYGISLARGSIICVCIDAARMASPNLLKIGASACDLYPRAIVGALSFHLGQVPQNESVHDGYDQEEEDALLETVNWKKNGYELFKIASFDPSSRFGLYECPAESNALFMRRELWMECGKYEPAFRSRGGGLVNLDLWRRLCADDRNILVILLGEGTFHQFHGGVATNAATDPWIEWHQEYVGIRGVEYRAPTRKPFLFGRMNPWVEEFEDRSSRES